MKNYLLILALIILISCKKDKKSQTSESDTKIEHAIKNDEAELLVQKILDLPNLQWIYHPELKERLPVKVLKTEQIDKSFNLNKFGQKVKILSSSELEKQKIQDYVVFEKLSIKGDTAVFRLYYKIEGAGAKGKLVRLNSEWKILDYSVWEN